jgi:hypothetical protein
MLSQGIGLAPEPRMRWHSHVQLARRSENTTALSEQGFGLGQMFNNIEEACCANAPRRESKILEG